MAGENTVSTADGLFKKVFAPKLEKAVVEHAILQNLIPFAKSDKELGQYFEMPVALSQEQGFTWNGTAGSAVALKSAKNSVIKPAQVYGYELVLRTQMTNAFMTRASQKGEKAFEKALTFKVDDMNRSIRKRLEIAMLYGQSGVGTVESATDLTGNVAEIVITEATWAGGIWAGAEGATLDSFTTTTKNNASGVLTITKVDSDNRKLTVTFTGTLSSEVAASDELYFETSNAGSSSFNEMVGLKKIITNSSTLFGIDAATYSMWRGSTVSSAGALTNVKLNSWVAKAVNKGLMEGCIVLVSPKGWGALNSDLGALRMLDSSYSSKKGTNGSESLEFYSQNGKLEVIAHPFVKDGDMFILPKEAIQRVGSVDVQFGLPGGDDKFFTWIPDYNVVELRCMADQSIFLDRPATAVYVSGLTYDA